MVYRIKEAHWCWCNYYAITDAAGSPLFRVDGAAFSWGDKLSFQDAVGQELAHISQVLLAWLPRYRITRDGQTVAEVCRKLAWFHPKFTLNVPGSNDYTIDGSFWQHDFTFSRPGRVVARVNKAYWSWTDSYGVTIADGEDVVLILCTCIVIDQVLFDRRKD